MTTRPSQITPLHLTRIAVVYVRQSSLTQVLHNTGSTALQRDLAQLLKEWGWDPNLVIVIDEDLGVSGSLPGQRHGFNTLLDRMRAGQIGIVAVTDSSRLSRNLPDLARFAAVAAQTDVLLLQGGQIVDFKDPNSEFVGLILSMNAVRENRTRADLAKQARRKKAEAGVATTRPPTGYVKGPHGTWEMDPDEAVRTAVKLIFDKYHELRSAAALCRYLRSHAIGLPRRRSLTRVEWVDPSKSELLRMLHDEAYAGTYVYGRREVAHDRPPLPCGELRTRLKAPSQWIYVRGHHEPYLSAEAWARIQDTLAATQFKRHPPAGPGNALLQGLLRCGLHDRYISTVYPYRLSTPVNERRRSAQYRCSPGANTGRTIFCLYLTASRIDALVEAEILQTLSPPSIEHIESLVREALKEHEILLKRRADELRHAERAVADAERFLEHTESGFVNARRRMLQRYDSALRHLEDLRTSHLLKPLVPPLVPSAEEVVALRRLTDSIHILWRHPMVSPIQRKTIARIVIKQIRVIPTSPSRLRLEIEWASGVKSELEIPRRGTPGPVAQKK